MVQEPQSGILPQVLSSQGYTNHLFLGLCSLPFLYWIIPLAITLLLALSSLNLMIFLIPHDLSIFLWSNLYSWCASCIQCLSSFYLLLGGGMERAGSALKFEGYSPCSVIRRLHGVRDCSRLCKAGASSIPVLSLQPSSPSNFPSLI